MGVNVLTSRKRLFVILIILIALMVALIFRVGYWNIVEGERLQGMAIAQWISDSVVPAKRGSILDRDMNVLAQSAVSDTVILLPQTIEEPERVATALSEILEMPYDEVYQKASVKIRVNEDGSETELGEVWLKRQISNDQSERIQALQEDVKGIKLTTDMKRYYPNKEFAAQIIGYTTADGVGQTGIERRFNRALEGRQGRMVAETDTHNNDIPNGLEMYIEPIDGNNVVLTLDEVMQSFLETACREAKEEQNAESVQGAIMDVTTGEILAMANIPEFDLNEPPRDDAEALRTLSANTVTASSFTPGSIFSSFTAAAAMDSGTASSSYTCEGAKTWDGEEIVCSGRHGTQSVEQAVMNDCSVASGDMSSGMGKQTFYDYMSKFGFGEKTGLNYTTDSAGDVPGIKYASDSDVAVMGAGQNMKVSQMQLLNAAASIVNGGTRRVPQLVLGLTDENGSYVEQYDSEVVGQSVGEETARTVREIFKKNVTVGSAGEAKIDDYTTGALYGLVDKYNDDGALVAGQKISVFMEFAPADNPKYMIMVTLNGVDGGSVTEVSAAKYANDVLSEVLKYAYVQPDGGYGGSGTQGDSVTTAETVEVPNVVDMGMQDAIDALEAAGFAHTEDGAGTVTGQTPAGGEQAAPGSNVQLEMDHKIQQSTPQAGSSLDGVETVEVPDFSGMTLESAMDLAISSGLKFYAQGDGVARKQYPVAGTRIQKGSTVTVTFQLDVG